MSNKRTGRMPEKTVQAVWARSGGVCEGCTVRQATQIHHRRTLARGGMHNLANLLHLCGSGNHSGCHGLAHSGDAPEGWLISRWDTRAEEYIPFTDHGLNEWQLHDAGGKTLQPSRIPF